MQHRPAPSPASIMAAALAALVALCHQLFDCVATLNDAERRAERVRERLAAFESWHEQFVNTDALKAILYLGLLFLHVVDWIVEVAVLANFAAYVAALFGGNVFLRIVLALLFALVGVASTVGVSIVIEYYRLNGHFAAMRVWQVIGVGACLLQPLLIGGVVAVVGLRHGLTARSALLTNHLVWIALVAGIISAVLILVPVANEAKAWVLFKLIQRKRRQAIRQYETTARAADCAAVHAWMTLSHEASVYYVTFGARPALPEMSHTVEEWARRHFRRSVPAPRGEEETDE